MQACLDHTFKGQRASCLVNPRSGYETELRLLPVAPAKKKKIAVASPSRAHAPQPASSLSMHDAPTDLPAAPVLDFAQVGAGPAGLAFSTAARERGHDVVLFEADNKIGGQVRPRPPGRQAGRQGRREG